MSTQPVSSTTSAPVSPFRYNLTSNLERLLKSTKLFVIRYTISCLSSFITSYLLVAGITNFDLLGNFGRLQWLGNLHIILTYNFVFAIATLVCIVTKFTAAMRATILAHFGEVYMHGRMKLRRRSNLLSAMFIERNKKD